MKMTLDLVLLKFFIYPDLCKMFDPLGPWDLFSCQSVSEPWEEEYLAIVLSLKDITSPIASVIYVTIPQLVSSNMYMDLVPIQFQLWH